MKPSTPTSTAAGEPIADQAAGEPYDMKALVSRFLAWPLPQTVAADGCATNNAYQFPRSGTNLLNADEAEAMLRYVLDALSTAPTTASALTDAVRLTIETIARQLDLIDERAPGNYLDKMPVVRSLTAHKNRLEKALLASMGGEKS